LYIKDGGIIGTPVSRSSEIFCRIKHDGNKENDTVCIHQLKLIKLLEEDSKDQIKSERVYRTTDTPKRIMMRHDKDDPMISVIDQTKYRSGVGMLL
jgi:hypothetical protein